MEILISLALFSVLIGSSLMLLGQAGRNLAYAREGYAAHLAASSLMLTLRNETALTASGVGSHANALNINAYSVWVFGSAAAEFHSANVPDAGLVVSGFNDLNISGYANIIVVVVWNEFGVIAGRAVGTFNRQPPTLILGGGM